MKQILLFLGLSFVLAGCALTQPPASTKDSMMENDAMMTGTWTKEEMEAMEEDHMMMSTGEMMKDDTVIKKETGYQVYSPELVANALKSGQKVALFFHATWCPSCKSLDTTIKSTLATIPDDTLVVKVDFDQYEDLRKQYRVTSQHTSVQLSADGTEKSRKLGARNLSEIFE